MKAHQGDHIILAASHVDEPTRAGVVLEVRGKDGGPPFLVRWADGHTGLMYPGPGSVLRVLAEHEHEQVTSAKVHIHEKHSTDRHLPRQPRQLSWVSLTRSKSCMPKIRPREAHSSTERRR